MIRTETVPLSDFTDKPVLAAQFPLVFENGHRWERFSVKCASCRCVIDSNNVRGTVVAVGDETYRTSSTRLFYISALARCEKCNTLTPVRYGISDGARLIGVKDGYFEFYAKPDEVRWWRRVWRRVARIFRKDEWK